MEKSKRELEALVSSQKEQLSRYEKRLKDVVTAYKGLLKEKEALETSLSAITATKPADKGTDIDNDGTTVTLAAKESSSRRTSVSSVHSETSSAAAAATTSNVEQDKSHMQSQIITLMNSLATLSAEKSRMEASFQADKKQLRAQLLAKEQTIAELQNNLKENEERNKQKVEEVKAKWIIERQEREKETNNQMLMIRELQKLYADERHLKENIEMQLNNFKTQFASNEAENTRLNELQAQLKEAKQQLKQMQNSGTLNAAVAADESNALLRQLQQEMQQLKDQHAIAIHNEQRRVLRAEELSRKQAALHEDRVANLEARLAELSTSVGTYDRLRQQDQDSIHALKKKLQELELSAENIASSHDTTIMRVNNNMSKPQDLSTIVEEIMRLKKLLLNENSQLPNPIDLSKVFDIGANHVDCQEDLNALQQQLDSVKAERSQLLEKTNVQSTHIATLQEKVKVLNRNIEEQELELKHYNDKLRSSLKDERTKWKERINEIENEYRCKVNDLEQQLQKQRQRSLQLLDEKEQEIKTLQTSFEIFHNATSNVVAAGSSGGGSMRDQTGVAAEMTQSSDAESMDGGNKVEPNKLKIKSKRMSIGENCHMLHYANELARKEIEIVALRKAKYTAETSLRKAIQDKVAAQEELSDRIGSLEEEVDRLERCKTREGANLEYLKNVIISFMTTKDVEGKRHMLNAISAVLQFTDSEIQTIHNAFLKK